MGQMSFEGDSLVRSSLRRVEALFDDPRRWWRLVPGATIHEVSPTGAVKGELTLPIGATRTTFEFNASMERASTSNPAWVVVGEGREKISGEPVSVELRCTAVSEGLELSTIAMAALISRGVLDERMLTDLIEEVFQDFVFQVDAELAPSSRGAHPDLPQETIPTQVPLDGVWIEGEGSATIRAAPNLWASIAEMVRSVFNR